MQLRSLILLGFCTSLALSAPAIAGAPRAVHPAVPVTAQAEIVQVAAPKAEAGPVKKKKTQVKAKGKTVKKPLTKEELAAKAKAEAKQKAEAAAKAKAEEKKKAVAAAKAKADEKAKLAAKAKAEKEKQLAAARVERDKKLAADKIVRDKQLAAAKIEKEKQLAEKAKVDAERRIARAKADEERKIARAKVEEERKLAAEQRRIAKAKADEERRIARAKAQEEYRLAKAQAAEERRLAAEAKARAAEELRLAKLRAEEERRLAVIAAAEAARQAELARLASMEIAQTGNNGELRSEAPEAPKQQAGLFGGLFGGNVKKQAMLPETRALDAVLELKGADKNFQVASEFEPQVVAFSGYPRGAIVVDTASRFLYLIESSSRARRYAIAVGREGLEFKGTGSIGDKQEWPRWIPTLEMQAREPEKYGQYKDGMPGGPENPLGARAMYVYQNGKDTHIRIHGTNQPQTIGTNSSNGCFRMINEHVMDLYRRVQVGASVIVI